MVLMNDIRKKGTPFTTGNGNKIIRLDKTLLIENFLNSNNYGTMFI